MNHRPEEVSGTLKLSTKPFKIGSRRYVAEHGTLMVPENRRKADSRSISIPILRIRAANDQRAEPIFWLEGGPGSSNLKFRPPAWLLAKHDIVMVGYRGVDGAVRLDCPEVSRALKRTGGDLLSAQSRTSLSRAMSDAVKRLRDDGADLAGYTIPEVVEDMEAARIALGYRRVNLLSASYGTRVAQMYAYRHPDSLYRSGMIGVNPPGHFVWEPATIDAQLNHYAALWARDPKNQVRTPDLAETMRQVIQHMPRRWLLLPIDPGKVKVVTFAMLFHRRAAAMVFDAYLAAAQGDASGLALMSLACDFLLPKMLVWGDLFAKGSSADFDLARDYAAELNPSDSIMGSPLALLIWGSAAGAWPINLIPAELRQVQPCDVETLLVSGSLDFSTPAEFATRELLPHLTRGKQVILKEYGHVNDVFSIQPQIIERLLTSFYEMGVVDDSLVTCVPMDFHVPVGFPLLAKAALGVMLLIMAIVIGFILR